MEDNWMNTLAPYLGVARAPFLALPFTLIAAGAAAAAYAGRFAWLPTLLALVGLVLLHAAVNALNEATDMVTGVDLHTTRTPFSGGSGTLPAGLLSVRATRAFAYACVLVGGVIGVYFAAQLGWSFAMLIAAGAVAVLFYSQVFARSGLGELFAGLGLGALPVWGAAWVQGQQPGAAALWAGAPAFFMTFNLLLLNEFPDEEADRGGGRRNLVLLLGRKGAALVYAAAALLTPASIVIAVLLGALPALALVAALPSLLLAKPLAWAFGDTRKPVPLPAMGANVVWNLATNSVLAIALVVARALR
jgi:1,4-dihydroxy-2-naphthoate octaprenyltransferase